MHSSATLLSLLSAIAATNGASLPRGSVRAAADIQCPIVFDGRVSADAEPTDFDSSSSIFNPDYVKGNNLKWSDILKFPDAGVSHFEDETYKPFEVTISDESIFQSQQGFRRAGLQFDGDTNNGSPGTEGIKTIHFSVKIDPQRTFNLSHEYLLVWHEAADCMSR